MVRRAYANVRQDIEQRRVHLTKSRLAEKSFGCLPFNAPPCIGKKEKKRSYALPQHPQLERISSIRSSLGIRSSSAAFALAIWALTSLFDPGIVDRP
jgi:hypothetical protein